ncbi:MAG: hypothetical protein QS748_11395 [Candidatus Endonucleobacter bathymodioli]|uniref:Uncharacterized protein n=1 Tax=Candidatus Endonucleibacter bathymodioli TaxID=539814 RepID=A0AA90NMZ8_9GAMM|nr:hypothetical protein [Candidatus Endonucleobacter bathymodioli]
MKNLLTTQPKLFVSTIDLNHQILRSPNDTKALLKWSEIETLPPSIYGDTNLPQLSSYDFI